MALQEDLFKSIDTIVQSRIANLPYDKTLECEVTNTDKASQGIYRVRYQAAIFDAITSMTNLKKGDIVYVSVPQGDFTQDKLILAKKKVEKPKPVKTLPFPSFVKGNNLFSDVASNKEYSVLINSGAQIGSKLLSFNGPFAGYTRLGIKMTVNIGVETALVSGDYGIKISLYGYDQSKITYNQSKAAEIYLPATNPRLINDTELYLRKEDMVLTNPYNTHGYQNQQKVIDITNYVISNIRIDLWQDNNFKDANGNAIEDQYIYFTNLQLYLGYDESDFKDNDTKLIIFSYDGLLYDEEYKVKNIYSRMITRDKTNNTYLTTNNYLSNENWQYIWEQYNPFDDTTSTNSNQIGFSDMGLTEKKSTLESVQLSTASSYTKNGYIFILRDGITEEHNYISNILWFTDKLYVNETTEETTAEQEEVTSFFTTDENGYVYLGNSSSSTNPLVIQNISLKGVLTIVGGELYFQTETEDKKMVRILSIKADGTSQFLGLASTADEAKGFVKNGKIDQNLQAIKAAITALGGNYTIID